MDKIIELKHSKKTYHRFVLMLVFTDGTEYPVECTFFGTSVDNPNFMLFSNAHPDSDSESDIPDIMINTDTLRMIKTLEVKEVER